MLGVEPIELHAGPLTMLYEAGDLRYVRLGELELVRRIYFAARDRNWGTAPNEFSRPQLDQRADGGRSSASFDPVGVTDRHARHSLPDQSVVRLRIGRLSVAAGGDGRLHGHRRGLDAATDPF